MATRRRRTVAGSDLTQREAAFVAQYAGGPPGVRFVGQQAVLAAGLTANVRSANVTAVRLLARASVRRRLAQLAEHGYSSAEKWLARTATLAYADATELFTYDGDGTLTLVPSAALSPAGRALLSGVRQRVVTRRELDGREVTERRLEVTTRDIDGARRDLGKVHRLLTDRQELTGPGGGPLQVEAAVIVLPANGRDPTAEPPSRRGAARARRVTPPDPVALPENGRGPDAGHAGNGGGP